MAPYKECSDCVTAGWCRKLKGEIPSTGDFCSARFRLDKALELSAIPKIYRNANLFNMVVDDSNKEAVDKVMPYLQSIVEKVDEGTNFFFYNRITGTGKTYLAFVLINQYIYKACQSSKFDFENPLAYWVSFADLIDELRYNEDSEYMDSLMHKILNTPLLLLDDVGAGTMSDFAREQANIIVNRRMINGLSTIYTSNQEITELQAPNMLGMRAVSRILSNCLGVSVGGGDRRIASIKKGGR